MVYLSNGWTTVATATVSNKASVTWWLEARVISQDINTNQSTIGVRVTAQVKGSAGSSGLTVKGSGLDYRQAGVHSISTSTWEVITEGSITQPHSSDGSLTMDILADISANKTWWNCHLEGRITLPTIPRTSQITISPTWLVPNGTNSYLIKTNRKSNIFVHDIYYSFGSISNKGLYGNVENEVSWTPPRDLLKQIPNSPNGSGILIMTTHIGPNEIGQSKATFWLNASGISEPKLSTLTIKELGSNANVGNSGSVYNLLSNKKVTVQVTTFDNATVKSIRLFNGTQSVDMVAVGSATTSGYGKTQPYEATLSNLTSGNFKVEIIDSRGFKATQTASLTFENYFTPLITEATINRTVPTQPNGTLTVKGQWFRADYNDISLSYVRTKEGGSAETKVSVPITKNENGTFAASVPFKDLDYEKSFVFDITAKDSFNQEFNIQILLPSAQYVIWFGKNTVRTPMLHLFKRPGAPCGIYNEGDLSVLGMVYADLSDKYIIESFKTTAPSIAQQNATEVSIPIQTPAGYKYVGVLSSYMVGSGILNYLLTEKSNESTAVVYLGNTWNGWNYPGGQVGVNVLYAKTN